MSPRTRTPSEWVFWTPPKSWRATASFSSSIPLIVGASESTILSTTVGSPRNCSMSAMSSGEISISVYSRLLDSNEVARSITSNVVLRTTPPRPALARWKLFRTPLRTTRLPGRTFPARSSTSRTVSPCGCAPCLRVSGRSWTSTRWASTYVDSSARRRKRVLPWALPHSGHSSGSRKTSDASSCGSWNFVRQATHSKTASRICGRTSLTRRTIPSTARNRLRSFSRMSRTRRPAVGGRPRIRSRSPSASGPETGSSSRIARTPASSTSSGRSRRRSARPVSIASIAPNAISTERSSG